MKLKSLFILFFSIFLLSLSSKAMATTVTVIADSVCNTSCSALVCTAASTTHTVAAAGYDNATITCTAITPGGDADIKALCESKCNTFKQRLRRDAGQIEDGVYNISKNSFTKTACNALKIVMGGAGKTFATFAVIATGIGFFTGKVSWGLMIGVAAGIATMFGGPSIVSAISGEDTKTMCDIQD